MLVSTIFQIPVMSVPEILFRWFEFTLFWYCVLSGDEIQVMSHIDIDTWRIFCTTLSYAPCHQTDYMPESSLTLAD